jgi:archaellum biogenesis ATPase FlaH
MNTFYVYRAEDGSPLYRVVRRPGKRFHQEHADGQGGWVPGLDGVRPVPYRLPELLAAVEQGEPVYVVEGEKDADRLAGEGLTATTNPGGAGKWRDEYAEHLRGVDIVVIADRDDPGREHARKVAASLRPVASSIALRVTPKGLKDVSDLLDAGHDLSVLEVLTDAEDSRYEGRVLDVPALLAQPEEPLPWRCQDFAADGYLTVLAGRAGEGKSWLTLALACGVACGASRAGIDCTKGSALIFDAENGERQMVRRLRAAGVTGDFAVQPVDAGGLRVTNARDLAWMVAQIRLHKANLVIFDSLRVLASGAKENSGDEMEPVVTALKLLARDLGVAIILVHHRGKDEANTFRGSTTIIDQCDLMFTVGRISGDPEGRTRRKLTTVKCRIEEEPRPRWLAIETDHARGLVYVNETDPYAGEEQATVRSVVADRLLGLLSAEPQSTASLARALGRDSKDQTVRRALTDLEASGQAEHAENGWRVSNGGDTPKLPGLEPNSEGGVRVSPPKGDGVTPTPTEGAPEGGANGRDGRVADCYRVIRSGGDPTGLYTPDEIRLAQLCVDAEAGS